MDVCRVPWREVDHLHRGVVVVPNCDGTTGCRSCRCASKPRPAGGAIAEPSPTVDQLESNRVQCREFTNLVVGQPQHLATFQRDRNRGAVSATATATPESVVWSMGDGASVTCTGPGTAYQSSLSPEAQSTACSYTYRTSSAGQPSLDGDPNDGAFVVTASIVWDVTWHAFGVPGGGALSPLRTSSTTSVRVEQIESVETAG